MAGKHRMHRKEAATWHHLTLQYGLMDAWKLESFLKMSAKEFSFTNGRSCTRLVVSCINKFLLSQDLNSRGEKIKATTSIPKFSDHSPLLLSIWGQPTIPNKPSHYFDFSLLKDEKKKLKCCKFGKGSCPSPQATQSGPPGWRLSQEEYWLATSN